MRPKERLWHLVPIPGSHSAIRKYSPFVPDKYLRNAFVITTQAVPGCRLLGSWLTPSRDDSCLVGQCLPTNSWAIKHSGRITYSETTLSAYSTGLLPGKRQCFPESYASARWCCESQFCDERQPNNNYYYCHLKDILAGLTIMLPRRFDRSAESPLFLYGGDCRKREALSNSLPRVPF